MKKNNSKMFRLVSLFFLCASASALPNQSLINSVFNLTEELIESFAFADTDVSSVEFLLYENGSNTPVTLNSTNIEVLLNSSASYFLIIHGWVASGTVYWIAPMAEALHEVEICNVIAVDWSVIAAEDYFTAATAAKSIGNRIASFLTSVSADLSKTQLIGHSLGAQISGFVGQNFTGSIGRIVGLDPAGPLFDSPLSLTADLRLSDDDAIFVNVVHTETVFIGAYWPCGKADYYINDGLPQPDCTSYAPDLVAVGSCGHEFSHTFMTLTILNETAYSGTGVDCALRVLPTFGPAAYAGYGAPSTADGCYEVTVPATGVNPLTDF